MEKLKIPYTIIVEGKYDKIKIVNKNSFFIFVYFDLDYMSYTQKNTHKKSADKTHFISS